MSSDFTNGSLCYCEFFTSSKYNWIWVSSTLACFPFAVCFWRKNWFKCIRNPFRVNFFKQNLHVRSFTGCVVQNSCRCTFNVCFLFVVYVQSGHLNFVLDFFSVGLMTTWFLFDCVDGVGCCCCDDDWTPKFFSIPKLNAAVSEKFKMSIKTNLFHSKK